MDKLHVPPPEGEVDQFDVNLAMFVVLGLAGLAVYGFADQEPLPERSSSPKTTMVGEVDPNDPLQRELKAQRRHSEKIGQLSEAELQQTEWTDEDRTAVFRFGPRKAAEVICQDLSEDIQNGELSKTMRLELEKTLDRRTEFAPWTCLSRMHFADALPDGDLRSEMSEFWNEVSAREGNPRLPISVLEDFRETRERPEANPFWSWLRRCALDFSYQAGTECRRLLYQISPEQGGDLLEMIEKHWEQSGIEPEDTVLVAQALGHLARNGQPTNWRVKQTEELPDYDVDFRQAAIGYLCRLVNTPTRTERQGVESAWDEVPSAAAEELRRVGRRSARAYEDKLLFRWRETCRIAFGGRGGYKDDEEYVPVPMLAVWDGKVESDPDYRIKSMIERGDCEHEEGYPDWYCLAKAWTDEERPLDQALGHYFIETRYMEWDDSFATPPPRSVPEPQDPEPKAAEPKAAEPKAAEPKAAEPEAAEPKAAEPKAVEPKAEEPAGTENDTP